MQRFLAESGFPAMADRTALDADLSALEAKQLAAVKNLDEEGNAFGINGLGVTRIPIRQKKGGITPPHVIAMIVNNQSPPPRKPGNRLGDEI